MHLVYEVMPEDPQQKILQFRLQLFDAYASVIWDNGPRA